METLTGEVTRWRMPPKAGSRWHIVEVLDAEGTTHAVTGCALPRVGAAVELQGEWQHHERFGAQFFAKRVVKSRAPLTPDGVVRWLCEHAQGMGPKRAAALLAAFGGNAATLWQAVEAGAGALAEAGIAPALARSIQEAYAAQGADGQYLALMHGWGMTQRQIAKVRAHWSLADASALLARDPYLLAEHIDGFGFSRADSVAAKLGIGHNDPVRVRAALLHYIDAQLGAGHVFADDAVFQLIAREARLPKDRLYQSARELRDDERLIIEDGARVYLPDAYAAECTVAADLARRFARIAHRPAATEDDDSAAPRIVDGGEQRRDPWQVRAVELLCDASLPIVFVTGGPGTGKTTVLCEALARLTEAGVKVAFAAPTGKAAKRMTEATGRAASTLHSLLGYRSATRVNCDVCRDDASEFDFTPIASVSPDLVIVDEASMVDVALWAALAEATPRARLAFVGDANQLPPVGPGQPFADALSVAPPSAVCKLRTVYRSKGEWVKAAAPLVLAGRVPELRDMPGLRWLEAHAADDVVIRAVELAQGKCDAAPYFTAAQAQAAGHMPILTPQRTGAAGTAALNRALHELYNPREPDAAELALEDKTSIRVGSWVMCGRNDRRRRICNGDTATVTAIDDREVELLIDGGNGEPVRYTRAIASDVLRLAYATTVHKSQGSEYPWAVVVCHSSHKQMLTRRLLYTAITRAKEGVVLLGDKDGVQWAIDNVREVQRCSWLPARVRACATEAL